MKKDERRALFLAVGVIVLLVGVNTISSGIARPLGWDTVTTKILEIVAGSFISIIGAWCCAWGVSDKAGESASKFLKAVWYRFLEALGR